MNDKKHTSISIDIYSPDGEIISRRDSISIDGGIIALWSRCGCCMHRGTLPATAKVRDNVTVPQDLDRLRHLGFETGNVSPLRGSETLMSILLPHTDVRDN